ncbi:MAG: hypothetical protein KC561_20045, partial [Myxococcales bacterium]|nr:hypothetical protein [Myxococcales bacterium]
LGALDTIVGYVLRQPNSRNRNSFEYGCPDGPATEPVQVFDATDNSFLLDLLEFVVDAQSRDNERPDGIDHFYIPSVRGADAMHLMNLTLSAYHMTGDEAYREFFEEVLLRDIRAAEMVSTSAAFNVPLWCRSYYGHHIAMAPFWTLLRLLEPSELRTYLETQLYLENWLKEMSDMDNSKFNFIFAGEVSVEESASARAEALSEGLDALEHFIGYHGIPNSPRRDYARDYLQVLSLIDETDIVPVCPTEDERALCEDGYTLFGVTIPGEPITFECRGDAGECVLGERCARPMASDALPVQARGYADFLWQRNPFKMSEPGDGNRQSPGVDYIEAFWLARYYDFIDAGDGQVLAWEAVGTCAE